LFQRGVVAGQKVGDRRRNLHRRLNPDSHEFFAIGVSVTFGAHAGRPSTGEAEQIWLSCAAASRLADQRATPHDVMVSAYTDATGLRDKNGNVQPGRMVIVAINYRTQERMIYLDPVYRRRHFSVKSYVTLERAGDNLKYYEVSGRTWRVPPRSVVTYVVD
jgi:hypothetical protein